MDRREQVNWSFLCKVLIRALILFLVFNLVLASIPTPVLGRASLYNHIFPGRERFPFGEDPQRAYNLSLYNFDAMFASHSVTSPVGDEYRIFLIGDSSVWGTLLRPEQTLAGKINEAGLKTCEGQTLRAYNLGYPTLSLFKDLMALEQAAAYDPDLVLWLLTLESFPVEKQLDSPIVANNARLSRDLIRKYALSLDEGDARLVEEDFWDRTLIGRRRDLADLARLQVMGFMWTATGLDQVYPDPFVPAQRDLEADASYQGMLPGDNLRDALALELLSAGLRAVEGTPVWFINEPILISEGKNSEIRYNFYYPRWAYDDYRHILKEEMDRMGNLYFDLWDIIPEDEFTNSAIHLSQQGSQVLAKEIIEKLDQYLCIKGY